VRVARLFGIDIRVHWTFLLLIALVALVSTDRSQFLMNLLWILAVFGSVLPHELSHCFVARRRGAVVNDILLTPIGGMSEMQRIPQAPSDEAMIAVVGPLTSVALGLAIAGIGALTGARLWPPTLFAGSWFARLAWLNLGLGGFNLLPALPWTGAGSSALFSPGTMTAALPPASPVALPGCWQWRWRWWASCTTIGW